MSHGAYQIQSISNTSNSSLTLELKRKGFNLRTGGGRKTLLDGYQLIVEEKNQIFEPVEEVEPVREMEFEEEDDF